MKQSKQHSVIESITNTVVGLWVSFLVQLAVYPLMGIPVTIKQNLVITFIFFVLSFVRGYIIRRIFNNFLKK
jgi:hypothetical protein